MCVFKKETSHAVAALMFLLYQIFTYFFFGISVPPLSVSIASDKKRPLSAGKEAMLECKCEGSRPAPNFRWFVGNRELDMTGPDKMIVEHHRDKGEWTSSVIKFVPKPEDNGKHVMCKASNEYFPEVVKEDGYIINVHCKSLGQKACCCCLSHILYCYHIVFIIAIICRQKSS